MKITSADPGFSPFSVEIGVSHPEAFFCSSFSNLFATFLKFSFFCSSWAWKRELRHNQLHHDENSSLSSLLCSKTFFSFRD